MKHPMQKVHVSRDRVHRFVENKIVRFLLDRGPLTLNDLARMKFDNGDREQFAQLIGYSVSGFGELSYVSDEAYKLAMHESNELSKRNGKR